MAHGNYDPKLSEAGFMDLVIALQALLKMPDAKVMLGNIPPAQQKAALQLENAANHYLDVVEGRGQHALPMGTQIFTVTQGHEDLERLRKACEVAPMPSEATA